MEAINILIGTTVEKVSALKKISFLSAGFEQMPKHMKELKGQVVYRVSNIIVLLEQRMSRM